MVDEEREEKGGKEVVDAGVEEESALEKPIACRRRRSRRSRRRPRRTCWRAREKLEDT